MSGASSPSPLTERQAEIAKLLADSKSADEIGELMGLRRYTINSYIRSAMDRTGTSKATGLVALCLRRGWIE